MENYSGSCSNGSLGSGSLTDHFKRKFIKCSAWDSAGKLWKTSHWSVRIVHRSLISFLRFLLFESILSEKDVKNAFEWYKNYVCSTYRARDIKNMSEK